MNTPDITRFIQACVAGDRREAEKIISSMPIETTPFEQISEGFKAAFANRHINIAAMILEDDEWRTPCLDIIAQDPEYIKILWDSGLRNCILYLFAEYCGRDVVSVRNLLPILPASALSILLDEYPQELYLTNHLCVAKLWSPLETTCVWGKLEVAQLLWSLCTADQRKKLIATQFESCFVLAAKHGHIDILKQLFSWVEPQQQISLLNSVDFSAFIYAADNGHTEIIKFIWESLSPASRQNALQASNYAVYRLATKNHHSQVIAFLEANNSEESIKAMRAAVHQGIVAPRGNIIKDD